MLSDREYILINFALLYVTALLEIPEFIIHSGFSDEVTVFSHLDDFYSSKVRSMFKRRFDLDDDESDFDDSDEFGEGDEE